MRLDLLDTINASCEASIGYGYRLPVQEVISTGIPQLDAAIGGGIPRGRIIEIFGAEDSGKTALALHLAQQIPGPTLYVDADRGLSPYIANGRDLYLLDTGTLENTLSACITVAKSGSFNSIVIDSMTALPTDEDIRSSINSKLWTQKDNRQAKVLSKGLPILSTVLHHTGCTLILVNQLRNKVGVMFGRPDHPTGGKAIAYYAALRMETSKRGYITGTNTFTGQHIFVSVEKCKYAPPGKSMTANLIYGEGLTA